MKIKSIKPTTIVHPGFLKERFGNNVSQMSVDISLKLKNAIKDVHRIKDGSVSPIIEKITKDLPDSPQGVESKDFVFGYEVDGTYTPGLLETDANLQNYVTAYPKHWEVVKGLIGLPRQKGRHPCGFVISSTPIDSFIPMTTVGGVRVTSFTAASVEAMGGLKMDFLTVNSVRDIGRTIRTIQERHSPSLVPDRKTVQYVQTVFGEEIPTVQAIPHKGDILNIWKLPQETAVFTDICKGRVETVFQLDGAAARQGLRAFPLLPDGTPPLKSMEDLSAFTALDRPGPLDAHVEGPNGEKHNMLVEYAHRARGESGIGRLSSLDKLASKTYGVIVYQEQLQNIFQQVGGTSGIQANNFRQRIGKKKIVDVRKEDKPLFMKGAVASLGQEEADRLWAMMETFGQYGFNKSHSVCYMHIAYACAWLKHHYPLEWWTSVLSNADRKDVDEKFWRYVGPLVLMPDVSRSQSDFVIEGNKIRAPVWLVHGIGEKAYSLLERLAPFKDIEDLLSKLEVYRTENGTLVTKTDKKTGLPVESIKKAHNPLNDSILRKLTVCGALDGLYPATKDDLPVDTVDKLGMFDIAAAKVRNKKKIKASGTKFNLASETARYQYIKSVMPAYSAPLLDMLRRVAPKGKFQDFTDNVVYFNAVDKSKYGVLTGAQFEWLEKLESLPESAMAIALPAYVLSQRRFKYGPGKKKEACELVLDIDGHRRQFVKWPGKDEGLPPAFRTDLQGGFVVGLFARRKVTDEFFFRDLEVIVPPYNDEVEESPVND